MSNRDPPHSPTSPAWGPSHPCFPHPNPHIPLSSPLVTSTRIIRIPRDYLLAGDLAPQFSRVYPELLSPWVSETQFRTLISEVNTRLLKAYDPWSWINWLDGFLALATGWLWEDVKAGIGGRRAVRGVEDYVEKWNHEVARNKGRGSADGGLEKEDEEGLVKAIELRRTGWMSLDIQIPDPKVGLLSDSASVEQQPSQPQRTVLAPRLETVPSNPSLLPMAQS